MSIDQKTRKEIEPKYMWNIADLFASDNEWQKEYEQVSKCIKDFDIYRGKLSDMGTLLKCLKANDNISNRAERLYVYANMKLHEDGGESFYQGMADKAGSLVVMLTSAVSFIDVEIVGIEESILKDFLDKNKEFSIYRHYIEEIMRSKEHILSSELEEFLAEAGEIGEAADNIFAMINNADMTFGKVQNDNGEEIEITQGRYISLMESKNVEVRKNTFKTYYESYNKLKNTLAATYNASVKKDIFFAKARKFDTALDAALFRYNIPRDVYMNLIETVHKHLPSMHKYIELRKKALGLSEVHMYDLYTPIVAEADTFVDYEKAKETVLNAFTPLGKEYTSVIKEAFEKGWIDVYENKGKRSGAYSWGAYGCHPYVLLNYDNKVNDMFTLAHEMGHAMHSHYSWGTQPYIYGDYTIFVAEVASTVNESLLMDYLLKTTKEPTARKYLINYYLEQFRGTLFRQVMFAEFEMKTHEMVENGEPLTVESLCSLYKGLNRKYYGDEIVLDDEIALEWARIPHFYSAFYVYQYATGFSAAVALSKRILTGDKEKVDAYLNFLKSGGSKYSIELLKEAGVDMTDSKPITDALEVFDKLISEFQED